MACTHCDHTGWVCETHTDRPWGAVSTHATACGCGGGTLCGCAADPRGRRSTSDVIVEAYRVGSLH